MNKNKMMNMSTLDMCVDKKQQGAITDHVTHAPLRFLCIRGYPLQVSKNFKITWHQIFSKTGIYI
jgi:hypothetical protein